MTTDRRSFLERLTLGTVGIGALDALGPIPLPAAALEQSDWDLTWTSKVTGQRRAVYDVPEIESGYGVWRAILVRKQYEDVLKVPKDQLSMVLVLRHNAICLAMNQAFWDKYNIGAESKVTDPLSGKETKHNPVAERTGEFALPPRDERNGPRALHGKWRDRARMRPCLQGHDRKGAERGQG